MYLVVFLRNFIVSQCTNIVSNAYTIYYRNLPNCEHKLFKVFFISWIDSCAGLLKMWLITHYCHHCWNELPTACAHIQYLVSVNVHQALMAIFFLHQGIQWPTSTFISGTVLLDYCSMPICNKMKNNCRLLVGSFNLSYYTTTINFWCFLLIISLQVR